MRKPANRRKHNEAKRLAALAETDPVRFVKTWYSLVRSRAKNAVLDCQPLAYHRDIAKAAFKVAAEDLELTFSKLGVKAATLVEEPLKTLTTEIDKFVYAHSRTNYLAHLFRVNKSQFIIEWQSMMQSWSHMAKVKADRFGGRQGVAERAAFMVIDEMEKTLDHLGHEARDLITEKIGDPRSMLEHEVARRISSVIDPRMCSVNFNWPKGEKEEVSTECVSS